jgi:hypothetical protein
MIDFIIQNKLFFNTTLNKFISRSRDFNNITKNMISQAQNKINDLFKKAFNRLIQN